MKAISKTRDVPMYFGKDAHDLKHSGTTGNKWYESVTKEELVTLHLQYKSRCYADVAQYGPYDVPGTEFLSGFTGSRDTYNPVYHSRFGGANIPFSASYLAGIYPTKYSMWFGYYRWPSPSALPVDDSAVKALHSRDPFGTTTRARAWHNMQPKFQSDANLLLSLGESRDFVRPARRLIRALSDLEVSSFFEGLKKRKQSLRQYDPSLPAAGWWLSYQLAIMPTIRDLCSIAEAMNHAVKDKQAEFSKLGADFQKSHYTEKVRYSPTGYTYFGEPWVWYGTQSSSTFTATLKYKYDYTMRDSFDAWLKYWGLYGSFETMWNLVPMSFVLDYFVQIGKSLRAMEHDPNVRLTDFIYGESVKTSINNGFSVVGDLAEFKLYLDGKYLVGEEAQGQLLAGFSASIYERNLATPYYGPAAPRVRLPGSKQGLTMLALARCFL